jgi:hypothetical protein
MIYHYTKTWNLASILGNGLKPTSLHIPPGERAVNWFTTNPLWENTVFADLAPTIDKAHASVRQSGHLLIRISCDEAVATLRWEDVKEVANMECHDASALNRVALSIHSKPSEWRCTLETVPPSEFLRVDYWDGAEWIQFQEVMEALAA